MSIYSLLSIICGVNGVRNSEFRLNIKNYQLIKDVLFKFKMSNSGARAMELNKIPLQLIDIIAKLRRGKREKRRDRLGDRAQPPHRSSGPVSLTFRLAGRCVHRHISERGNFIFFVVVVVIFTVVVVVGRDEQNAPRRLPACYGHAVDETAKFTPTRDASTAATEN